MAPAKSTTFNFIPTEPLASANATPAAAETAHVGLPQSGYLTAEWVKRHYSISNSTLYAWIGAGRFPAPVKIGPRAVRWTATSLRAFETSIAEGGR